MDGIIISLILYGVVMSALLVIPILTETSYEARLKEERKIGTLKKKKRKKNTSRFTKSREEFEVLNQLYIECTIVDGFIIVGEDHYAYQIVKDVYYPYPHHVISLDMIVKLKKGRELVIYSPYRPYYYVGISNKGK